MDELVQWLHAHKPAHSEVAVVHGDYRLDNMIVHPTKVWLCYSHIDLYEAPVLLYRHVCVCACSHVWWRCWTGSCAQLAILWLTLHTIAWCTTSTPLSASLRLVWHACPDACITMTHLDQ